MLFELIINGRSYKYEEQDFQNGNNALLFWKTYGDELFMSGCFVIIFSNRYVVPILYYQSTPINKN